MHYKHHTHHLITVMLLLLLLPLQMLAQSGNISALGKHL